MTATTTPDPQASRAAEQRQTKELARRGWSGRDARDLVALRRALEAVTTSDRREQQILSRQVATLLQREPVRRGAECHLLAEEHEFPLRLLAGWLEGDDQLALLELASQCEGRQPMTLDGAALDELLTDDLGMLSAARAAEARGDFARALEILREITRPLNDTWALDLHLLLAEGERLHPARWGRWICSAALRYWLATPIGLTIGAELAATLLEAMLATPEQLQEQILARAMTDPLVHDALLFDLGGLDQYLHGPLARDVAARTPGLPNWPETPLSVVRIAGGGPDGACARSLTDSRRLVVGDEGLAEEQPPGTYLMGRLVSFPDDERAWFALKPVVLDDLTATRVAAAITSNMSPQQRLVELAATRRQR